jgi:hypothetical protein
MKLLKLVPIFLMVSCASFPHLHPYALSIKNNMCAEYKVKKQTDVCSIEYVFVKWHPLSDCEGYFALPPEDIAALRDYQKGHCASK